MDNNQKKVQKILWVSFYFLITLLLGFIILGIWSWFGNIEESITGFGEMVPDGKLRRVMSPTNGVVSKVHVSENQKVNAGDLLIELDPETSKVDKDSYTEQLSYLNDEITAIKAALRDSSPSSAISGSHSDWLKATRDTFRAQYRSAKMQISRSEHLYKESLSNESKYRELAKSGDIQLGKYKKLAEEGGLSENDLEIQKQDVIEKKRMLEASIQETQARKFEISKSIQELNEVSSNYKRELLTRLTRNEQEVLKLKANVAKSNVNVEHQFIRAPIDGIVNEQVIRGLGEVVKIGDDLLSLVPIDSELVAEVKVTNQDLSYIRLEQQAALRIDALPYQQFGRLNGVVESMSPSTVTDEQGMPFYVIKIRPNKTVLQKDGKQYPLRAGMTLSADIITREKSVLSFFIEPVKYHLDRAFHNPSNRI